MSIAALVRRLADAGATPQVIALAVEAVEAAEAKGAAHKAKRAEQKRRERERRTSVARLSTDKDATVAKTLLPPLIPPRPLHPHTPL